MRIESTYRDTGGSQGAPGARQSLLPTQSRQPLRGKETGGAQGSRAAASPSCSRRREHGRDGGTLLGTVPLCCPGSQSPGQDAGPLQVQWCQRGHNPKLPSPEVLTSRPGSPCFPGSPCRQGGGEGRDTPTLPQAPHEHPRPRAEGVWGVSPFSLSPVHSAAPPAAPRGDCAPPVPDHAHPRPHRARRPRFAF